MTLRPRSTRFRPVFHRPLWKSTGVPAYRAVLFCGLLLCSSGSVRADWYSGDPYTPLTAWPQFTDNLSSSQQILGLTYDNFNWTPSGSGIVRRVGGHFWSANHANGSAINSAYWEIRSGMSHNVGGSLLYSGSGSLTTSPTLFTQGGYRVWQVDVDVPDFSLAPGAYWFGMAIGVNDPSALSWYVASTYGANGIGGPLGDDLSIYFQSIFNGSTITWNYAESAIINPTLSGFDPSYYLHEVPEPSSLAWVLCSVGLAAAVGRRRRRIV